MGTETKVIRNASLIGGLWVVLAVRVFLAVPSPTLIKIVSDTIDRKLQEIEKHMAPRIVQAAEENRLRMVRWLDEKPR